MTRRYPLDPLQDLTGWTIHGRIREIAPANASELRRRKTEGVTEAIADRLATAAGLHPWEIWPDMAKHAITDASRPCAGCGATIEAPDPRRRYCSDRCRKTAAQRRWRSTPAGAAHNREACARYRAEHLEYERRRNRLKSREYRARKRPTEAP